MIKRIGQLLKSTFFLISLSPGMATASEFQSWHQAVEHSTAALIENARQKHQKLSFVHLKTLLTDKPASWYSDSQKTLLKPLHFTSLEDVCAQHNRYRHYKKKYAQFLENYYESLDLSPSEAVLTYANRAMIKGLRECENHYPTIFSETFNAMMRQEKKIHERGSIVLYHGTSRFNYALSYLHTKLHDLFNQPSPGYLHLRQPLYVGSRPKQIHDYLKQGGSWLQFNDTQHLLFCNCALTANLKQHLLFQEDSITFFTQETTIFTRWKQFLSRSRRFFFGKKTKISIKKLFKHYGLEDFYKTHKEDIIKIINFQAPGNIMLQIELSSSLAQKALYPAEPIGKRRSLTIDGKKCTNPTTILKTLSERPSSVHGINGSVWCLILTGDLLLNPHHPDVNGNIHFYRYSMDEKKLQEIEKMIDLLIEKIEK